MVVFFAICIFLFNSCCWDEPYSDIIIDETSRNIEMNLNLLNCKEMGFEFILRSQSDLDSLQDDLERHIGCAIEPVQNKTSIDFDKFSVIGKNVAIKGCNPFFIREVVFNSDSKIIDYNISSGNCGWCNYTTLGSDNAILVPKIPNDYQVRFNIL
jgi:hypothetical protein